MSKYLKMALDQNVLRQNGRHVCWLSNAFVAALLLSQTNILYLDIILLCTFIANRYIALKITEMYYLATNRDTLFIYYGYIRVTATK